MGKNRLKIIQKTCCICLDTLVSGSPILQDGKLVGALTHVLVDDIKTGYGIYAENMLDTAQNVGTGVLGGLQDKELKQAS